MNIARKRIPFLSLPVLAALSFGCVASAQEPVTTPAFEVSTVRPSSPDAQNSNLDLDPDSIRSSNMPIMFLLKFAFNLNGGSDDQVIGAPSWVSSLHFDIRAKASKEDTIKLAAMPAEERAALSRKMIQALLADRFQLRVHHENRELHALALTIAKGGSRLTAASDPSTTGKSGSDSWTGLHNSGDGVTEGRNVPIAMLVNVLSSDPEIGGRLVIDQTGLTGKYNFKLTWAPSSPEDQQSAADQTSSSSAAVTNPAVTNPAQTNPTQTNPAATLPSLFHALQEQLGLRLEAKKAPVDCIVIDHIEQPSPN